MYKCGWCDRQFDSIPVDAFLVPQRGNRAGRKLITWHGRAHDLVPINEFGEAIELEVELLEQENVTTEVLFN